MLESIVYLFFFYIFFATRSSVPVDIRARAWLWLIMAEHGIHGDRHANIEDVYERYEVVVEWTFISNIIPDPIVDWNKPHIFDEEPNINEDVFSNLDTQSTDEVNNNGVFLFCRIDVQTKFMMISLKVVSWLLCNL